jgi:hypothetical protein
MLELLDKREDKVTKQFAAIEKAAQNISDDRMKYHMDKSDNSNSTGIERLAGAVIPLIQKATESMPTAVPVQARPVPVARRPRPVPAARRPVPRAAPPQPRIRSKIGPNPSIVQPNPRATAPVARPSNPRATAPVARPPGQKGNERKMSKPVTPEQQKLIDLLWPLFKNGLLTRIEAADMAHQAVLAAKDKGISNKALLRGLPKEVMMREVNKYKALAPARPWFEEVYAHIETEASSDGGSTA